MAHHYGVSKIDRARLAALMSAEERRFAAEHPRSRELHERAIRTLIGGVPMTWMVKWAGPFPLFVDSAQGARFRDVDGRDYVDLCLGDTAAMAGHAPPATMDAVAAQLKRGLTHMLPTEDAAAVGEELTRRFGLPLWQFTLSATDANRFAIRLARLVTGRSKVLVHDFNYHGSVDEAFAWLTPDGRVEARRGNLGPPVDPALTTKVVPFNDVGALERALAPGDVAVVMIEPALTNIGIVLPEAGYHDAVRELTRRTGTLLLIDETHTICAGPGGYTAAHGLAPDLLVIGKAIGGGIPVGTYGMTEAVAGRVAALTRLEDVDIGGIGGTLAGNALSMAATRATLAEVLTPAAFARMIPLAERWQRGVADVIAANRLPWHVARLGCRAEYGFLRTAPRNGAEQWAAGDFELERYLHLHALNRGVLLTPFHNMALMCPVTTESDVDRHTEAFAEAAAALSVS
jgi:glutamate-1-semialdehyde aminotransferase